MFSFRIIFFATCILAAAGSDAFSQQKQGQPAVVRPEYPGGPPHDLSDRPVETILHKYDPKSLDRYLTTGTSISFRFPVAYYSLGANQNGGAQREIKLDIDYRDLRAVRPRLRALELPVPLSVERRGQRVELEKHRVFVRVLSSLSTARTPLFKIRKGTLTEVGRYCGLAMYADSHDGERNSILEKHKTDVQEPFATADNFVSDERIDNEFYKGDYLFKARCSSEPRMTHCVIDSYFEIWSIQFRMPKENLCSWRNELQRMSEFLFEHVTNRTEAPARPKTK